MRENTYMEKSYKNLLVWQKSMDLVEEIYVITKKLPPEELYGLSSQMRRAAISIPSNIAEGSRRKDLPEYIQFLRISDGSSAELETQLALCRRLYQHIDCSKADALLEEIQKMLHALIRSFSEKKLASRISHLAKDLHWLR